MAVSRENKKLILQAVFGLLFIGLTFFFIRHERAEVSQVRILLGNARTLWVLAGIAFTCIYILTQGWMYANSFRTVGQKVPLATTTKVYLKRNFVSVFLPAGGVASLGFFTQDFQRKGISLTKVHFASSIYAFTGILSVVVVAIPALLWAMAREGLSRNQFLSFVAVCLILLFLVIVFTSLVRRRIAYRLVLRFWPELEHHIAEIQAISIRKKAWALTLLSSVLIECIGVIHLVIAFKALGLPVTLEVAVIGYITAVMFLIISPFLRGLGAVELSMTFVLTRFGLSTIDAISVTLLYRFFEFWLPLLLSGSAFIFVKNNLLLRVVPAVLTFILGIVNIISVLTPAIQSRLELLREFIPLYVMDASNYFVLMLGLFLLVTSAFLLKGLRTAWYLALGMALFSLIGHLVKAIDYEEALMAGFLVVSLIYTRQQYIVRSNPRFEQAGIATALSSALAVIIYGTIGFYFLDRKYFRIDFDLMQSLRYSFQNFFLFRSEDLHPAGIFARDFLYSINIAGFLSLSFLFYNLVRPYVFRFKHDEAERELARGIVEMHGRSGMDHFKTSPDKLLFFNPGKDAFLAYRVAGNYAVVLEDPVSRDEETMKSCIRDFDRFCRDNGLKCFYYRVPEESLKIYADLQKKHMLFGQEAVVNLERFTLEGRAMKGIRNSCNKAKESGFHSRVYHPPVSEELLAKLKAVSDEWLDYTGYKEIVFSQGRFDFDELRNQPILTIENSDETIAAFLNIIPDHAPGEGTCDLIRRVREAPNGITEFLMAEFFLYLKSHGQKYAGLGFAPMSGIGRSLDVPEMSIRFAYEKIRTFSHYRGLRDFKEKFDPEWFNRYIIYDNHYDLFNLPSALRKVIKP